MKLTTANVGLIFSMLLLAGLVLAMPPFTMAEACDDYFGYREVWVTDPPPRIGVTVRTFVEVEYFGERRDSVVVLGIFRILDWHVAYIVRREFSESATVQTQNGTVVESLRHGGLVKVGWAPRRLFTPLNIPEGE